MLVIRAEHLRYFFNFFTKKKDFSIFYQVNLTGQVGFLNRTGAEIGY